MTGPNSVGDLVRALKDQASRLGLTWELQTATVISGGTPPLTVQVDGDTATIPVISMIGSVAAGSRVYVVTVPPSGKYILGTVQASDAWVSYVPTIGSSGTAWSVGNGTLTGKYRLLNSKTCAVNITLTWGSTSVAGTGTPSLSLPFAAQHTNQCLSAFIKDASASTRFGTAVDVAAVGPTGDIMRIGAGLGTGTVVSATAPMTWAVSDVLCIQGVYEIA